MILTESSLRVLIRRLIFEQVVGYETPAQKKQGDENPDYVDDGDVSMSSTPGSQPDKLATQDAVRQLTQQRQSQLDSGSTVDAEETGRELGAVRKRRG